LSSSPDRDGTLNGELVHVTGATRSVMPGEPKTAVVPLALGMPVFALIFSFANAALLAYRIRIENEALAWAAQAA